MALNQPEAGLPLSRLLAARRGGNIVLIVEDLARHSPLPRILSILLREIRHAEIQDSQIEILFATGVHPPLTPEQADRKLGPELASIRRRCNACRDPAAHVKIGSVGNVPIRIDLRGGRSRPADHRLLRFAAFAGGVWRRIQNGPSRLARPTRIRGLHRQGIGALAPPAGGHGRAEEPDARGDRRGAAGSGRRRDVLRAVPAGRPRTALHDRQGEVLPAHRMLAKQAAVFCGSSCPRPPTC